MYQCSRHNSRQCLPDTRKERKYELNLSNCCFKGVGDKLNIRLWITTKKKSFEALYTLEGMSDSLPQLQTPYGVLQCGRLYNTKSDLELAVGHACQIQARNWKTRTSSKQRVEYVCKYDKECSFFVSATFSEEQGRWKIKSCRHYHLCQAATEDDKRKGRRHSTAFRTRSLSKVPAARELIKSNIRAEPSALEGALPVSLSKRQAFWVRRFVLDDIFKGARTEVPASGTTVGPTGETSHDLEHVSHVVGVRSASPTLSDGASGAHIPAAGEGIIASDVNPRKRRKTCSVCKGSGHNIKTCPVAQSHLDDKKRPGGALDDLNAFSSTLGSPGVHMPRIVDMEPKIPRL